MGLIGYLGRRVGSAPGYPLGPRWGRAGSVVSAGPLALVAAAATITAAGVAAATITAGVAASIIAAATIVAAGVAAVPFAAGFAVTAGSSGGCGCDESDEQKDGENRDEYAEEESHR